MAEHSKNFREENDWHSPAFLSSVTCARNEHHPARESVRLADLHEVRSDLPLGSPLPSLLRHWAQFVQCQLIGLMLTSPADESASR